MGENEETIPCRLIPVLALVIEGKRNKEIAEECSFAEHTVEKYVSDLLTLYGCHSRTELALNPEARAAVGRGEIGEVSGSSRGRTQGTVDVRRVQPIERQGELPKMRISRAPRSRLLSFVAAAVVAFTAVSVTIVVAQGGDDPPKRQPERDKPGAVVATDLPAGRHLDGSEGIVVHGRFVARPINTVLANEPDKPAIPGASYSDTQFTSLSDLVPSVFPAAPQLLLPYRTGAGGGRFVTSSSGATEVVEASIQLDNGRNYPIRIGRWQPAQWAEGGLFAVAVPVDGNIQVTLGDLGGRPAVFKHRRAGVRTPELQEVYFVVGGTVVAVESYADDFDFLIRVARELSDAFTKEGN